MYRAEANIEDCKYILDNLRAEDKIEVETTLGKDWKELTLQALEKSGFPYLLAKTKENDTPVLIAGAWPTEKNNPSVATVWLLSTPEIEKHQICFLKEMKKELEEYDKNFGLIYNQIYKTNHIAKKWLKWAGFRFPAEERKKTIIDREFLKYNTPKDFEFFYREREIQGLMKGQ